MLMLIVVVLIVVVLSVVVLSVVVLSAVVLSVVAPLLPSINLLNKCLSMLFSYNANWQFQSLRTTSSISQMLY